MNIIIILIGFHFKLDIKGVCTVESTMRPKEARTAVSRPRLGVLRAQAIVESLLREVSQVMIVSRAVKIQARIKVAMSGSPGRCMVIFPGLHRPAVNSSSGCFRRRGGRAEAA